MHCPDCDGLGRREFLKTTALGGVALATAHAASRFTGSSETLVTTLYKSLEPHQKEKVVFPFDHELRSKVDANWMITPFKIARVLHGGPAGHDRRDIPRSAQSGIRGQGDVSHPGRRGRAGPLFGGAVRDAGLGRFRVRGRRTALHGAVRRRFGGGRGIRRPDVLRPRVAEFQRGAGPSQECLLVSGQARQPGLSGARRQAARSRRCWAIRARRRAPRPSH